MNSDDDEFNVRLGRIGNRGRGESFVNQVLRAARKDGHEAAYAAGKRSPRFGARRSDKAAHSAAADSLPVIAASS